MLAKNSQEFYSMFKAVKLYTAVKINSVLDRYTLLSSIFFFFFEDEYDF